MRDVLGASSQFTFSSEAAGKSLDKSRTYGHTATPILQAKRLSKGARVTAARLGSQLAHLRRRGIRTCWSLKVIAAWIILLFSAGNITWVLRIWQLWRSSARIHRASLSASRRRIICMVILHGDFALYHFGHITFCDCSGRHLRPDWCHVRVHRMSKEWLFAFAFAIVRSMLSSIHSFVWTHAAECRTSRWNAAAEGPQTRIPVTTGMTLHFWPQHTINLHLQLLLNEGLDPK